MADFLVFLAKIFDEELEAFVNCYCCGSDIEEFNKN